ncbi:MAG: hydroxymethylbilane synthase [Baekduia sp.]
MRLGTRGSQLALAQARLVAGHLVETAAAAEVEIVPITTSGDRGEQAEPIGKRRWVDTIEDALANGEIDLAVHSAKDVPGDHELAQGMSVGAVLARADARDVLVGASSLDALATGARVGTASLRRRAELLAMRPDLDIVEIRGNVPTRLAKLEAGEADALVLAAAGLDRLGLGDRVGAALDPSLFVPAPGQGILAIEGRKLPDAALDAASGSALAAERAISRALGANCESALGCYDDGAALHVFAGSPDGTAWIRDTVVASDSAGRVRAAIERLDLLGAKELIAGG